MRARDEGEEGLQTARRTHLPTLPQVNLQPTMFEELCATCERLYWSA